MTFLHHSYFAVPRTMSKDCDEIMNAVCSQFGMTVREIKQKCRKREIVRPRQIAMYLLRNNADMSFTSIAALFKCDHTSVIHNAEKAQDLLDQNDIVRKKYNAICFALNIAA